MDGKGQRACRAIPQKRRLSVERSRALNRDFNFMHDGFHDGLPANNKPPYIHKYISVIYESDWAHVKGLDMNWTRSFFVLSDNPARTERHVRTTCWPEYKTVEHNWFIHRTFHVPNLTTKFGISKPRRLNRAVNGHLSCFRVMCTVVHLNDSCLELRYFMVSTYENTLGYNVLPISVTYPYTDPNAPQKI